MLHEAISSSHFGNLRSQTLVVVVDDAESTIKLQEMSCEFEEVLQIILAAFVPRRRDVGGIGYSGDRKILRNVDNDQVESQVIVLIASIRNSVLAACPKLE